MEYVVTPQQAKEIDKYMIEELSIPSILLMEQAASALASEAESYCTRSEQIIVVCGKGNNGGDGLAAARILMIHGDNVHCIVADEPSTPDAKANAALLQKLGIIEPASFDIDIISKYENASLIIDALFGTGLKSSPKGIYKKLIDDMNRHSAKVISADIPSGIFGNTGKGEIAVYADTTIAFQYPKPGHFLFPGREHTGTLKVAKIGISGTIKPSNTIYIDDCSLPERKKNTNKGNYGKLGIIAGSKGMSGAAVMSAKAAIASGCGLTRVGCIEYTANIIQCSVPEATVKIIGDEYIDEAKALSFADSALAIGPGLGTDEHIERMLRALLPLEYPKVIDADALNVIADKNDLLLSAKNAIITPHPKEFARLTKLDISEILADPIGVAEDFALTYHVVVLLKGATTIITDGTRNAIVTSGCPGMAKGGSGDVLTGVIGALIAQGHGLFEAGCMGAFFCGKAGESAAIEKDDYSMTPIDTIKHLKFVR